MSVLSIELNFSTDLMNRLTSLVSQVVFNRVFYRSMGSLDFIDQVNNVKVRLL